MIATMVLALVFGSAVTDAEQTHYETALQCLVAINDADAIERAVAGKEAANSAVLEKSRDKYKSILVFEGLSLGKTREQIAAEYTARQNGSATISGTKNMAELKTAYGVAFKKAAQCSDRI